MFTATLLLAALGCAHHATPGAPVPADASPDAALGQAIGLIQHGHCADAIAVVDRALVDLPTSTPEQGFVATRVSGLVGAFAAMTANPADGAATRVLVQEVWPDLLYAKAFCQVDLGDFADAEKTLTLGLTFLPGDAVMGCELGHLLQERKDWQGAFTQFEAAYANAAWLAGLPPYTAENGARPASLWGMSMSAWQGRALRGEGFSLVELHRLDDAEAAYREALTLDPTDAQAKKELDYIATLRAHGP
jgi:tetratricopeptide (TPR) repeat protein